MDDAVVTHTGRMNIPESIGARLLDPAATPQRPSLAEPRTPYSPDRPLAIHQLRAPAEQRETAVIGKLLGYVVDAMTAENIDVDTRRRVVNRVLFGDPMPEPIRRADEQFLGDLDNWKPTGLLGGQP